jgi:hypothetical protein
LSCTKDYDRFNAEGAPQKGIALNIQTGNLRSAAAPAIPMANADDNQF